MSAPQWGHSSQAVSLPVIGDTITAHLPSLDFSPCNVGGRSSLFTPSLLIEEYPTLHPSTPAGAVDMILDMFCRHLNDTLGVAWDRAGIAAFHFHFDPSLQSFFAFSLRISTSSSTNIFGTGLISSIIFACLLLPVLIRL